VADGSFGGDRNRDPPIIRAAGQPITQMGIHRILLTHERNLAHG
jgi:hypothetical protein